jgi:biopolymer transport protein ExbB
MDVVNETKSLLLSMGASPIMWFMIFLSLVSISVMLERALFFRSIAEDVEVIARRLSALLGAADYDGALALMRSSPSAEAAVVLAGLLDAPRGVRAAREAMAGAAALQRKRLERRLGLPRNARQQRALRGPLRHRGGCGHGVRGAGRR